jgi:alkylhydroperoxidase family enzyme
MAHVSLVEKDQAAETVRPIYDNVEKKLGAVLNMFKALAHNPGILQTFLTFDSAAGRTKLSPTLRELAYLKTSELNGCHY